MKVFITVELENEVNPDEVMSKASYVKLFELIDLFRKEGIKVQYKETNLPRYSTRFTRASEIEKHEG